MHHFRMYNFAIILAVILSIAAFGGAFKILDPRFQHGTRNKENTEGAKTSGKASGFTLTEALLDANDFNNTVPKLDIAPMPEEGAAVDSSDLRQIQLEPSSYPPHPFFYAANTGNTNILPVENRLPEPFQTGNLYNPPQYYPAVQSFPVAHPYIPEDIRYVPTYHEPQTYQDVYNYIHEVPASSYSFASASDHSTQRTTTTTNAPVRIDCCSNNGRNESDNEVVPTEATRLEPPSAIEDYMVKKILEIVNDLSKSNITLSSDHIRNYSSPKKNVSIVATTSVNRNNTTRIESTIGFDDTETENHSEGNRTVTSENAQQSVNREITSTIRPTIVSTTMGPQRYLVKQFMDPNGNPCMQELVTTTQKKKYVVYTCEQKPRTSTPSNVVVYKDELKADFDTTTYTTTDEPITTTPMTADQTLPTALNDYAIFNMQE